MLAGDRPRRRRAASWRSAPTPPSMGGAMGDGGCKVVARRLRTARWPTAFPIIGLWHSGGARLRRGRRSRCTPSAEIFHIMTRASGKIPQISVVLGPAAGGAAYGPALTDVVILGPEGRIFVTGPDVVRSVTGEDVDMLRLGGPEPHGRRSGVVHVLTESEARGARPGPHASPRCSAPRAARRRRRSRTATSSRCCRSPRSAPTTCTRWSRRCSTRAPRSSCTPRWAPNIVTDARPPRRPHRRRDRQQPAAARRLPRLAVGGEGRPVRADVRRVRRARWSSSSTCPATCPASARSGTASCAAAPSCCTRSPSASCPRVTLVTRKAYGGAYIAMNSRALGATRVFAWPGAEVAVMGAVAAVRILHRRRLAEVPPDVRAAGRGRAGRRARADRRRPRQGGRDRRRRRGRRADPAPGRRIAAAIAEAARRAAAQHGNIPL